MNERARPRINRVEPREEIAHLLRQRVRLTGTPTIRDHAIRLDPIGHLPAERDLSHDTGRSSMTSPSGSSAAAAAETRQRLSCFPFGDKPQPVLPLPNLRRQRSRRLPNPLLIHVREIDRELNLSRPIHPRRRILPPRLPRTLRPLRSTPHAEAPEAPAETTARSGVHSPRCGS
jgi:hypothetical protein